MKKLAKMLGSILLAATLAFAPAVVPGSIDSSITVSAYTTISSGVKLDVMSSNGTTRDFAIYYSNGSLEGIYYGMNYAIVNSSRLEVYNSRGSLVRVYTNYKGKC